MGFQGDTDREAKLAAVEAEAKRRHADMPEGFAAALFARAAAEDLAPLTTSALATLAAEAWQHLSGSKPGAHHVRVYNPDPATLDGREVTVIELVNDDMPFLVDSALGELTDRGLEPRLVLHPILGVDRDGAGAISGFQGDANTIEAEGTARVSLIHLHVDRIDAEAERKALAEGFDQTLKDVRLAVSDWRAMRGRVRDAIDGLHAAPRRVPREELTEAGEFLEWLLDDNFTFLGIRRYTFEDKDGGQLEPDHATGLGILRDPGLRLLRRGSELVTVTPEIRNFLNEPVQLIVTKASVRSRVHRRAHLDYIGIKLFGDDGRLNGEMRIVGLFTATAYTQSTRDIPLLRRKVGEVLKRAGFDPESHSGKALVNVLESYPRDELFQVDAQTLFGFAMEVLALYERPRIRVLPRPDRFDRFVSVIVFVPRDKYDSDLRLRVGRLLAAVYGGHVSAYYPAFPEGLALTRVHYIIGRRTSQRTPDVPRADLEKAVAEEAQSWSDRLRGALSASHEGGKARALATRYSGAFGPGYQEVFAPEDAVEDIRRIERLTGTRTLAIDFWRRAGDGEDRIALKIISRGRALPLSERVPLLENMGLQALDERTFAVEAAELSDPVFVHDMTLRRIRGGAIDLARLDALLEALFMAVAYGHAESDGFNALAIEAGLGWRDVALIRALARYLRQVPIPFSQDYLWSVLVKHSAIAAAVVELFHIRFDPARKLTPAKRASSEEKQRAAIEAMLDAVESLDEDRILRRFVNLVEAAQRTTFYQLGPDGQPREVLAFKFESHKVEGLPAPRPLYEIFVYSTRVEGVHLRFGHVARGGLRWSDRPQDFRTEVLGLVKAQQVKNAVIVPVGAKGGFVPKQLPPASERAAWLAEGTEAYKIFVSTLLDLTDDLEGEAVRPPQNTVRHDGDDPYLVVAADKGTATFSDTANAISIEHGFWLDDAFASGGSAGYDHKKMGITARGAWEAVKRHFREMDVDIQSTPFTVAGVGDMSGDVFGNGMLLSHAIKLVAAFDHRDIFIDPTPDPEKSFAERKRLFDLPRSSWQDYDKGLISRGGGVYSRAAKSISLSPEAKAMLGLSGEEITPQQVMTAILRLDVDLLWFGGIGTYIRASAESDAQVGDRANDAIRITGGQVRAKVIGEGANLGVTQRGRIEAAGTGVRLNTDAIDNSAGVNTSDVEVNIKIAFSGPMREGALSREDRNVLLAEMTDEVAQLVLRNNYQQTLALSLAERRGLEDLGFERRLMQTLEARSLLDRAVEFLPDEQTLAERARTGQALTRPELAVLLAYAKITLYNDLLASGVPDDPFLGLEVDRYFPAPMRARFAPAIAAHRLRREIISTGLANSMINRGGPSFVVRLADQTGADVASIAAAFAAVRGAFRMMELNGAIDALDARVPGAVQLDLYSGVQDLLLSRIVWFLRNVDLTTGLEAVTSRFREGVDAVRETLDTSLGEAARGQRTERTGELMRKGVPEDLARWIASLPALAGAPDVVLVAERAGRSIPDAAATFFAASDFLGLDRLRAQGRAIAVTDYYERLALDRAIDGIGAAERAIAVEAARAGTGAAGVQAWSHAHPEAARVQRAVQEIVTSGLTLAKLTVAASLLTDLSGR